MVLDLLTPIFTLAIAGSFGFFAKRYLDKENYHSVLGHNDQLTDLREIDSGINLDNPIVNKRNSFN